MNLSSATLSEASGGGMPAPFVCEAVVALDVSDVLPMGREPAPSPVTRLAPIAILLDSRCPPQDFGWTLTIYGAGETTTESGTFTGPRMELARALPLWNVHVEVALTWHGQVVGTDPEDIHVMPVCEDPDEDGLCGMGGYGDHSWIAPGRDPATYPRDDVTGRDVARFWEDRLQVRDGPEVWTTGPLPAGDSSITAVQRLATGAGGPAWLVVVEYSDSGMTRVDRWRTGWVLVPATGRDLTATKLDLGKSHTVVGEGPSTLVEATVRADGIDAGGAKYRWSGEALVHR